LSLIEILLFSVTWLALIGVTWLTVVAVSWASGLVVWALRKSVFWKVLAFALAWLALVSGLSILFSESINFKSNAINYLWSARSPQILLSADGATIAAISNDHKAVTLYDQNAGKRPIRLETDSGEITSVGFSPNGKLLATGTSNLIRLWDIATGKEQGRMVDQGGPIVSLAFSPDGKTLASGSSYGSVWSWDVSSGNRRFLEKPSWIDDPSMDYAPYCVAFSPDGKTLAAMFDERIGLWDSASGKHTAALDSGFPFMTFTSDAKLVAFRDAEEKLTIRQLASARLQIIAVLCALLLVCLLGRSSRRFLKRKN
jgi:WD40 repeat protein